MIQEIEDLLASYVSWLKDRTTLRQVNTEWVQVTTPYLDRHNDYLQIYVKRQDGGYLLTDDGYVIEDLEQSGCSIGSTKREQLLKMTLNGFGVQLQGKALQARASADNFAQRKHNLVQAMLAVNDMFYLSTPMVASLFYEDVVAWLDLHEIRYTPKVKLPGKTGYDHLFDFVIPKSKAAPERIVQTINRPSRDTAQSLVLAWIDTKDVRPVDSRAYAFLNDVDQTVPVPALDALRNYDVVPVLWSQRETARAELAA
jgi:hypothetical protein